MYSETFLNIPIFFYNGTLLRRSPRAMRILAKLNWVAILTEQGNIILLSLVFILKCIYCLLVDFIRKWDSLRVKVSQPSRHLVQFRQHQRHSWLEKVRDKMFKLVTLIKIIILQHKTTRTELCGQKPLQLAKMLYLNPMLCANQ